MMKMTTVDTSPPPSFHEIKDARQPRPAPSMVPPAATPALRESDGEMLLFDSISRDV
jgi:hypothetical protein